jgi:hypothetical protein
VRGADVVMMRLPGFGFVCFGMLPSPSIQGMQNYALNG